MASFSNELSQQTWENVLKTDDVNQAYDSFLHIFMDIFNKHCPMEKVTPKSFEGKQNLVHQRFKPCLYEEKWVI